MYIVALTVSSCCSGVRFTEVFQDDMPSGTWLTAVAEITPGMPRIAARSSRVMAMGLASRPMPITCTRSRPVSSTPLGERRLSTRSEIRNTALHTIAQVTAICSAISAAAVLWRRRLERMGRMSMAVSTSGRSPDLLGFQLDGGGDLHGAPCGQQAGEQAGDEREHEGQQQHRRVEVRQLGVGGRLLAYRPQPERRQAQAQGAAGQAHGAGPDQGPDEDRAPPG